MWNIVIVFNVLEVRGTASPNPLLPFGQAVPAFFIDLGQLVPASSGFGTACPKTFAEKSEQFSTLFLYGFGLLAGVMYRDAGDLFVEEVL